MFRLDEEYKQRLVEEVCEFVRIPSRSSLTGGEEGRLQLLVAERMAKAGARVRMLPIATKQKIANWLK